MKYVFIILCLVSLFSCRDTPVNPNQHIVHKSDGTTYRRTNPNATKTDNINPPNSGFGGKIFLIGIGVVILWFRKWLKTDSSLKKEIITHDNIKHVLSKSSNSVKIEGNNISNSPEVIYDRNKEYFENAIKSNVCRLNDSLWRKTFIADEIIDYNSFTELEFIKNMNFPSVTKDILGRIVSAEGKCGYKFILSYNESGDLIESKDSLGNYKRFRYSEEHQLSTVSINTGQNYTNQLLRRMYKFNIGTKNLVTLGGDGYKIIDKFNGVIRTRIFEGYMYSEMNPRVEEIVVSTPPITIKEEEQIQVKINRPEYFTINEIQKIIYKQIVDLDSFLYPKGYDNQLLREGMVAYSSSGVLDEKGNPIFYVIIHDNGNVDFTGDLKYVERYKLDLKPFEWKSQLLNVDENYYTYNFDGKNVELNVFPKLNKFMLSYKSKMGIFL